MKSKKIIIPLVIIAVVAVVALLICKCKGLIGGTDTEQTYEQIVTEKFESGDIETDASVNGISVVSVDTIMGMYVEDGSDDVLSDILTVTFRNDADVTLQYAKLILSIGEEDYFFDISTVPPGQSVRAMEINRKSLVSADGDVSLNQENIVWFNEEPSMCEDVLSVEQSSNGIVLKNISSDTITAPVYVFYKNYVDGVLIGGITYRAGTDKDIKPGETVVLSAGHFDPEVSQLMFITYGS